MSEQFHTQPRTSRRKFIGFAAGGVAAAAGGAALLSGEDGIADQVGETSASGSNIPGTTPSTVAPRPVAASEDVEGRTLVVIELQGGNDGLATLVPRNAGVLHDRREAVHIVDEELLDFTDDFGWHPALAPLLGHNVAALVGVGSMVDPDGSHFEMERRWW